MEILLKYNNSILVVSGVSLTLQMV